MIWALGGAAILPLLACGPAVRPAPFPGARDQVTDATLVGPFDGQVVDETTGEPIAGATVLGVWTYEGGEGLLGPLGSEVQRTETDQAGRYRVPPAPRRVRGPSARMIAFHLYAYKRGYVGYRSDRTFDGAARHGFTVRRNRVPLRKWRETDSHATHLAHMAGPPFLQKLMAWEREAANAALYKRLGGTLATAAAPTPTADPTSGPAAPAGDQGLQVLDAGALLPPAEVRRRTGYTDAFDVKELGDLRRTHFYHGVHLEASERDETWDVAYRVWKDPPGGLDPVVETFQATLPGVKPSTEVTAQTWVLDGDSVRAVAFIDPEQSLGVLLTCGASQCVDIETAIILANFLYGNADSLVQIAADSVPARPDPKAAPAAEPETTEPEPAEPEPPEPEPEPAKEAP